MPTNHTNPVPSRFTHPAAEVATPLPLPATALCTASTVVLQLALGEVPAALRPSAAAPASGASPSYYMKVRPDTVIQCARCSALWDRLTDLQVRLAGPLAVLLAADEPTPTALREELCRGLLASAAEKLPLGEAGWNPHLLLRQTSASVVRYWPAILAVAQLLAGDDEVALLDLVEVAIPELCRTGPLPPALWQLLRLCETETREALAARALASTASEEGGPDLLRLREELWRWENLMLYVAETEAGWGPARETQWALLHTTAQMLPAVPTLRASIFSSEVGRTGPSAVSPPALPPNAR